MAESLVRSIAMSQADAQGNGNSIAQTRRHRPEHAAKETHHEVWKLTERQHCSSPVAGALQGVREGGQAEAICQGGSGVQERAHRPYNPGQGGGTALAA